MNRPSIYTEIAKKVILTKDLKSFRGSINAANIVKEIIQKYENLKSKQIILDGLYRKQKRHESFYPDSLYESDDVIVKNTL